MYEVQTVGSMPSAVTVPLLIFIVCHRLTAGTNFASKPPSLLIHDLTIVNTEVLELVGTSFDYFEYKQ